MTKDSERFDRITKFISPLGYPHEKQFKNWYTHLSLQLKFPFEGLWKRTIGVKAVKVKIVGLCDFKTCLKNYDILVKTEYQGEISEKPLFEIIKISADSKTKEAVEDWHYWVKSEYWMEE